MFGLVTFIEQKENDNNGDLLKSMFAFALLWRLLKQCEGKHGFYIDCHCYRFLFAREMPRGRKFAKRVFVFIV